MQSVTSLTGQIKSLLETTFLHVKVQGEVSRPTYHSSGHLYFNLKDDKSSINCVMFRGNNQRLKFRIEDGMEVNISGSVSVYTPRGTYQINCVDLEPSGSGALALAFEQLKKELAQKGYFDNKRALPKIPKHIALVTSKTGAALQDMLKVANARWPLVKITLFNVLVQGESASGHIAKAIKKAQTINPDIIVIGRGGGSVEDLWAFNEREVAEALHGSKIPTVSAVGHAIDTVISDFVADVSAPTPSAAMEMILPDINEFRMGLDNLFGQFKQNIAFRLKNAQTDILSLKNQLNLFSPLTRLNRAFEEVKRVQEIYKLTQEQNFRLFFSKLESINLAYKSKNPENFIQNGYAQISKNGKILNLDDLKPDDIFELQSTSQTLKAKILDIIPNYAIENAN